MLLAELSLSDLSGAFLVEIGSADLALQLLELVGLDADLLDLALPLLINDLHLGHLTGQVLLHGLEVESAVIGLKLVYVDGVERSSAEVCHTFISYKKEL